jgi:hypothetical protein
MKFVITESDKLQIRKQYGLLLTEAPSPAIELMGNQVNDGINDWISKMKRIGIVSGTSKAGVNILVPIEELRNYVLSLLPKKWADMSTTGEGGNEFRNNVTNKIYELTKSEISKIPFLKRKAAKALMFTKYGGKEKYIQTEFKNWGGSADNFIWNLITTPFEELINANGMHLDYKNPQQLKWMNYERDITHDHGKRNNVFLRQLLGLVWDSL